MCFFFLQIFTFINITYKRYKLPHPHYYNCPYKFDKFMYYAVCPTKRKIKRGLLYYVVAITNALRWRRNENRIIYMHTFYEIAFCLALNGNGNCTKYSMSALSKNIISFRFWFESDYDNVVSSPLMQLCCKRLGNRNLARCWMWRVAKESFRIVSFSYTVLTTVHTSAAQLRFNCRSQFEFNSIQFSSVRSQYTHLWVEYIYFFIFQLFWCCDPTKT